MTTKFKIFRGGTLEEVVPQVEKFSETNGIFDWQIVLTDNRSGPVAMVVQYLPHEPIEPLPKEEALQFEDHRNLVPQFMDV